MLNKFKSTTYRILNELKTKPIVRDFSQKLKFSKAFDYENNKSEWQHRLKKLDTGNGS